MEKNPQVTTDVFNQCLTEGEFPNIWKLSELILIEKPKKDALAPKAYRPVCLLDISGKLLKTLIKTRLERELKDKNILHNHQYGFRKGRSTIDAVSEVMKIHVRIKEKAYKNQEFCSMITLDIKKCL